MSNIETSFNKKIELLLDKLFEGKCINDNHGRLDVFLKRLSKQEESETPNTLLSLPIFAEWLKKAVDRWCTAETKVETCTVLFAFNLARLLSKQEQSFSKLNRDNFFGRLIDFSQVKRAESDSFLKLEYVKLLSTFLDHKSGLSWMRSNYYWSDIFQWSLSNSYDRIAAESTTFMSKLLERTISSDETFTNNVIKRILAPLSHKVFKAIADSKTTNLTEDVGEYFKPTLKLMGGILDHFLEGLVDDDKDHRVLLLFVKNLYLEDRISYFMRAACLKSVIFDLGKVVFIVEFLELYIRVSAGRTPATEVYNSVRTIRKNYVLSVSKGNFEDVLEFCRFGHLYWRAMEAKILKVTTDEGKEKLTLPNQFVPLQLMPVWFLTLPQISTKGRILELLADDLRDSSVYNFLRMLEEDVIRGIFHWRNYFNHNVRNVSKIYKLASLSLLYLKNSRKYFQRHTAVVVFQTLFYNLCDFIEIFDESPTKFEKVLSQMTYVSQIFEMLLLLIEDFKITWKESIEVTQVLSISFQFLSMPRWSKEVTLNALRLIRTSIANSIAENMALLVDKTSDGCLDLLGTFLFAKSNNDLWEVRKEICEIIYTMAHISKYSELFCLFCLQLLTGRGKFKFIS